MAQRVSSGMLPAMGCLVSSLLKYCSWLFSVKTKNRFLLTRPSFISQPNEGWTNKQFKYEDQYRIVLIFCGSKFLQIAVFDNFVEKKKLQLCYRSRRWCEVSKISFKIFQEWHRIRKNRENLNPQNISTIWYIFDMLQWAGHDYNQGVSKHGVSNQLQRVTRQLEHLVNKSAKVVSLKVGLQNTPTSGSNWQFIL